MSPALSAIVDVFNIDKCGKASFTGRRQSGEKSVTNPCRGLTSGQGEAPIKGELVYHCRIVRAGHKLSANPLFPVFFAPLRLPSGSDKPCLAFFETTSPTTLPLTSAQPIRSFICVERELSSTNRVSLPFVKKEVLTVKLRFMPSAGKPSKCLGVFLATSAPFDR